MKTILFLLLGVIFISCHNKNIPDVSHIKVALETRRFEQDFFAMDTTEVSKSIKSLMQKYPDFLPDFVMNIMGLDMDSVLIAGNPQAAAINLFIRDYTPMKDSSDKLYKNFDEEFTEIKRGLQFVKYYFPEYPLPQSIITFIGPINANFKTSFGTQGDVLTAHSLGVALQFHLGNNFSFYKSAQGQEMYPDYLINNFDAQHISVNCMRNIVDDLYPDKSIGKALLEQMVINGRNLFLVTRFLPETPEYVCMGYTEKQMKDSYKNEAVIWDFFLNNNLLNNSDQNIIKNYIGEGPKTQELGDDAPGNIGTFAGLQIVKKYMEKYPKTTFPDLMNMDPRKIYADAKYKPRN